MKKKKSKGKVSFINTLYTNLKERILFEILPFPFNYIRRTNVRRREEFKNFLNGKKNSDKNSK